MALISYRHFVFCLSFADPTFILLFVNWFPSGGKFFVTAQIWLCLILSIFEACINLFAWIALISIILFLTNFCVVFTFWCKQLHSKCVNFSKRTFPQRVKLYRELQILTSQFNDCFAHHVQVVIVIAFINLVSDNFGTIKLYNELPYLAWMALPYLSVFGALNIVTVINFLANPFENSTDSIESWRTPCVKGMSGMGKQHKYFKWIILSCNPLKLKYGALKFLRKGDGLEWLDSLIDSTVIVLLW